MSGRRNWGRAFRYSVAEVDGGLEYREWFKAWVLPITDTGRKPAVDVPRPELWDVVTEPWLHARSDEVVARLQRQDAYDVRYARDDAYASALRRRENSTEGIRHSCSLCHRDGIVVQVETPSDPSSRARAIEETHRAIEERVTSGRFAVIRADIDLEQMVETAASENSSIVAFLRCLESDETILWHLRGTADPIYSHVHDWAPFAWKWTEAFPWIDNAPDEPSGPAT